MDFPIEVASACGAMTIGSSMMLALAARGIGSAGHDSAATAVAGTVVVGNAVALTN